MRFKDLGKAEDDTFFVTAGAVERKRAELERILKVEIPENTKGIALAAAEGDLSENFEYKARRDKQQLLSARAGKLQEELGRARALDPATIDTTEVGPGARVTLEGPKGERRPSRSSGRGTRSPRRASTRTCRSWAKRCSGRRSARRRRCSATR